MAYTYHIDAVQRLAQLTFTGSVTGPELGEALVALYGDPAWQPGYDTLWDFRAITELLLDEGDLKGLVEMDLALDDVAGSGRDALIVARDLDHFIGKLFLHLARHTPRANHLCTTLEEARAWLGLSDGAGYRAAA